MFEEVDESVLPSRRSPGMMIEDQGKEVKDVAEMVRRKPGKLEDKAVNVGNMVAYDKFESRKPKIVCIGKVLNISGERVRNLSPTALSNLNFSSKLSLSLFPTSLLSRTS